jgi:hypothetical protein
VSAVAVLGTQQVQAELVVAFDGAVTRSIRPTPGIAHAGRLVVTMMGKISARQESIPLAGGTGSLDVWVEPSTGYGLRQLRDEREDPGGRLTVEVAVDSVGQFGGVWAPVSATWSIARHGHVLERRRLALESAEFGPQDAGVFSNVFPAGMWVFDERSGAAFQAH